jgi:hypothetical protein
MPLPGRVTEIVTGTVAPELRLPLLLLLPLFPLLPLPPFLSLPLLPVSW